MSSSDANSGKVRLRKSDVLTREPPPTSFCLVSPLGASFNIFICSSNRLVYFQFLADVVSVGAIPFEAPEAAPQLSKFLLLGNRSEGKGRY